MTDATLSRIESSLRLQHEALAELIEIALFALKESGDASVTTIHMNTRLHKLAAWLKLTAGSMLPPSPAHAENQSVSRR